MNHAITVGDIVWLSVYSVSAIVVAAALWWIFLVYIDSDGSLLKRWRLWRS